VISAEHENYLDQSTAGVLLGQVILNENYEDVCTSVQLPAILVADATSGIGSFLVPRARLVQY
jgi:hypothetical protein